METAATDLLAGRGGPAINKPDTEFSKNSVSSLASVRQFVGQTGGMKPPRISLRGGGNDPASQPSFSKNSVASRLCEQFVHRPGGFCGSPCGRPAIRKPDTSFQKLGLVFALATFAQEPAVWKPPLRISLAGRVDGKRKANQGWFASTHRY